MSLPALNSPTLIVGPTIPASVEAVGIAFVAAPNLKSSTNVAVLSAERYVAENFSHVAEFELDTLSQSAVISATYEGTKINDSITTPIGAFTVSSPAQIGEFSLKAICNPITSTGLYTTQSNAWYPYIRPGIVLREYIVKAEEFDTGTEFNSLGLPTTDPSTQDSWLARSGAAVGQKLILIYTVPEHMYGPVTTNSSNTFPNSTSRLRPVREWGTIVSPTKITHTLEIKVLTKVLVNGITKFSGNFDNTVPDTFIKRFDRDTKTIELTQSLAPTDFVELEFLTYSDFYIYSGFRDISGNWWPFDANPEYGHIIGDWRQNLLRNSADCLLEQVTLYLIPTAYIAWETVSQNSNQTLNISFKSAFNYGEFYFTRHLVGLSVEDITIRQQDGPTNTWGHAVFGRNFYDESPGYPDDVFSLLVPSMMPLAKIILTAPASVNSVAVADIRQRGGGVPEAFIESSQFQTAITSSASGLDTLRSFFDLGIWQGAAIKTGGVTQIEVDTSILDTFTSNQVEEYVRQFVCPGVDFQIIYTDV